MIRPVGSFAELSTEAAAEFGTALAMAGRIIEEVVRPKRVYVSRWGEVLPDLHAHLFPRTRWVLDHYRRAFPGDGPPSGPALFEWARTRYGTPELPSDPSLNPGTILAELRDAGGRISGSRNPRGH